MLRIQCPHLVARQVERLIQGSRCDTSKIAFAQQQEWGRPVMGTRCATNGSGSRQFHRTALSELALPERHGTTIVCVRKNGQVCMMGDGMVSQGDRIVKPNVLKIRRIPSKDPKDEKGGTIVGFAGATADAFTLLERLEGKLDEYPGQLSRSCVELAKGWRTDKYLRRLEAALIVADSKVGLEISGNGDVLESHDGVLGVGSGSPYAIAAARALMDIPELSAEDVARKAMTVAADMCVYTNHNFRIEVLDSVIVDATAGEGKEKDEKEQKADEKDNKRKNEESSENPDAKSDDVKD